MNNMKSTIKLFVLLTALFIVAACNPEKEGIQKRSEITYFVSNTIAPANTVTIDINSDKDLDELLDRLCDYAENGRAVTFYSNVQHSSVAKKALAPKETTSFSTTSREEMKHWMARMEDAGLTVTVTYDSKTGTYNGYAYVSAPQPQTEEGPKLSRVIYNNSYNAGMEGQEEHVVCTFTWEEDNLTTVDMVERRWQKNSDGSTGDTMVVHSIAVLSYNNNQCTSINIYDTAGNMLERCEYTYIEGCLALEWQWSSSTTKTYIYNNEGYVCDIQNTVVHDNGIETVPNRFRYGWENDDLKYIYLNGDGYGDGRVYQTVEYDNTLSPRGIIFGSLTFMPGSHQFLHPQILWSKHNMSQLEWYVGSPSPRVMNYTYTDSKPTSAEMRYDVGTASWVYEYIN